MEFVNVVNNAGTVPQENSNVTITNYPSENKVVINNKHLNNSATSNSIYGVKYKVPKGTPAGTYSTAKAPHAVITTYDGEVFESDALTTNTNDLTTLAPLDTCNVVDTTENKLSLTAANGQLNPNNETWGGSIQINNKNSAGVKKIKCIKLNLTLTGKLIWSISLLIALFQETKSVKYSIKQI